jgi:hypothetical protein
MVSPIARSSPRSTPAPPTVNDGLSRPTGAAINALSAESHDGIKQWIEHIAMSAHYGCVGPVLHLV